MFCFKSAVVLGFFLYTLLLRYPQRKKYCDQGHAFRWILKCWRNILWFKTESLFLKYVSTAKSRCPTDQRFMATEIFWVSLEERSRTNSPRQRFHSQLFSKIVRYFCRTLYIRSYRTYLKAVTVHHMVPRHTVLKGEWLHILYKMFVIRAYIGRCYELIWTFCTIMVATDWYGSKLNLIYKLYSTT
jgi:hypothetical protein